MIEVEIYEEEGRYHWNLFFVTGILGGGADSLEEAFEEIYYGFDEMSNSKKKFPLVFRDRTYFNGFMEYLKKNHSGDFSEKDFKFDAGPWVNCPEWAHQGNGGDSANFTQTDTDEHGLTRNGADGGGMTRDKEVTEMDLDEAVGYLRRFRDWHSGNDCRTLKDAGLTPREAGMAMDVILSHHGRGKPIRECERCKYYDCMFGYCHKVTEGGRCDRDER